MRDKPAFDLETFLPYRLNRAAEAVSIRFAAQYKARFRMTRPEWRTLAALGTHECITATEIGSHASMHKTKVSRAVKALEDRRWLRRRENERDRREEHLELTPLGRQSFQEMVGMARAYERELAGLIGSDGLDFIEKGLDALEKSLVPAETMRAKADPSTP